MKNRPILPAFDMNGREVENVVFVQLGKDPGKLAQVYRADYDNLVSMGVSGNWSQSASGQVMAQVTRGLHTSPWKAQVSRLIAKAKAGEAVRFRDHDYTNLLSDNLYCTPNAKALSYDWQKLQERQEEMAVVKEIAAARAKLAEVRALTKTQTREAVEKLADALKKAGGSYARTNQSVCAGCEDTVKGCDGGCATGY